MTHIEYYSQFMIGDVVQCLYNNSANKMWHKYLEPNVTITEIRKTSNTPDEFRFLEIPDQWFYANDFQFIGHRLKPKPTNFQGLYSKLTH